MQEGLDLPQESPAAIFQKMDSFSSFKEQNGMDSHGEYENNTTKQMGEPCDQSGVENIQLP